MSSNNLLGAFIDAAFRGPPGFSDGTRTQVAAVRIASGAASIGLAFVAYACALAHLLEARTPLDGLLLFLLGVSVVPVLALAAFVLPAVLADAAQERLSRQSR